MRSKKDRQPYRLRKHVEDCLGQPMRWLMLQFVISWEQEPDGAHVGVCDIDRLEFRAQKLALRLRGVDWRDVEIDECPECGRADFDLNCPTCCLMEAEECAA